MYRAPVNLNYGSQSLEKVIETLENNIWAGNDVKLIDAGKNILSFRSSNYSVSQKVVLDELETNIKVFSTALLGKNSTRHIEYLRRNANVVLELRRALQQDVDRVVELKENINSRLEEILQPQGIISKFNELTIQDMSGDTRRFQQLMADFNHQTLLTKMDQNEIYSILTRTKSMIIKYIDDKNRAGKKGKIVAVCGALVTFACTVIGIFTGSDVEIDTTPNVGNHTKSIIDSSGSNHQNKAWIWVVCGFAAMISVAGIVVAYKNREDSHLRAIVADIERV